jgi:hypothetical protein
MKKTMTIAEAEAMQGTEFIYEWSDGDTILAFVKKFDEKIGLTCMSLETKSRRDKYEPTKTEGDGTFCVIGYDFKRDGHNLLGALSDLQEIKETGRWKNKEDNCGSPNCAF